MLYTWQFPPSESASETGLRIEGGPVLRITPSERYALQLIAQGTATSQIGARLGLARADIEPFLATLFTRLGVTSRADAVGVASRRGLLMSSSAGIPTDACVTTSNEHT
jgi:DNA-binding NarL/FixJ family response regulator